MAVAKRKTRVGIIFGPSHGFITRAAIDFAARDAKFHGYDMLLVLAYYFEANAVEQRYCLPVMCAEIDLHVLMASDDDVLKIEPKSELFVVLSPPVVRLENDGDECVAVLDSCGAYHGLNVPCWMLDTDYDGQCFRADQIFFPRTCGWENIKKKLKGADFAPEAWDVMRGNRSMPFSWQGRAAVKVLTDHGSELIWDSARAS